MQICIDKIDNEYCLDVQLTENDLGKIRDRCYLCASTNLGDLKFEVGITVSQDLFTYEDDE